MDRRTNPYAPGAGLQPPELAGRDTLIEQATADMDRVLAGRPVKGLILLGLRGVGKTVLLNRLFGIAEAKGFETAKVEAPEGGTLPQLLGPEIRRMLYHLDLRAAAGTRLRGAVGALRNFVRVFKVKVGDIEFGLEPAAGQADTGILEQDLPDLLVSVAEAAAERKTAVGLFIDELQYLSPEELSAVVVSCHQIAQRNLPLFFVGAGLPQMAALAGNAKSYAERLFDYPKVDRLEPSAGRAALLNPAQSEGVSFEADAVDEVLRLTECYPYFIQEWGFQVWNTAPQNPIRRVDVDSAMPHIVEHLDSNFFRVRFDRLTALQRKYLRAMAELGPGPQKSGEIAGVLGVDATAVATVRQHLIQKGMIWSQRHGETEFTVPMFDTFLRRQMPAVERYTPRRKPRQ